MTRFSARHALVLIGLLALSMLPIAYGRLSPLRDECPGNGVLLDALAIDPLIEVDRDGPRPTRIDRGRLSGVLPPQSRDEVPMPLAVVRTFGLPNLLLAPASILPGRREPDDVQSGVLTTETGQIPVAYAYERRGRLVRVTGYVMAHRGVAIASPLWTRISNGPRDLIGGRWPITLFAASARAHSRQLEPNLERIDDWLKDAWSHYQAVCKISASEPL